MKVVSRKPESIRRYVFKFQSAAFLQCAEKFIDVSTECAVFFTRINAELFGEQKIYRIIARIVPGKREGKCQHRTGHEGPKGKQMPTSTLFLTSGLGGRWSKPRPVRFTPGKDREPTVYEAGPQGRSGRVLNISPPQGFDPRTVQPVASRYID